MNKIYRINEEFSGIHDTNGYGIVVKNNEGTEIDPYEMIYQSNFHPIKAGNYSSALQIWIQMNQKIFMQI
jgi:hypothetical protein